MERRTGLKRVYQRKTYNAEIIFAHHDKAYNGILLNVSLGGAFISTRHVTELRPKDVVAITIPYTDGKKNIRRHGVVKWKNSIGFAIEFI